MNEKERAGLRESNRKLCEHFFGKPKKKRKLSKRQQRMEDRKAEIRERIRRERDA